MVKAFFGVKICCLIFSEKRFNHTLNKRKNLYSDEMVFVLTQILWDVLPG